MKTKLICALALLCVSVCALFCYTAYTAVFLPPDSSAETLERKLETSLARVGHWDVLMDAELLAAKEIDGRLYAAFTNTADGGQLWCAIFYRDLFHGWEVSHVDTGAAADVAVFEDTEALRLAVAGVGGGSQIARYELWTPDGGAMVYGADVGEEPFVHAVAAPDGNYLHPRFFDPAGNDITEQVWEAVRMNHGYTPGSGGSWRHGIITISLELFGWKITREVAA